MKHAASASYSVAPRISASSAIRVTMPLQTCWKYLAWEVLSTSAVISFILGKGCKIIMSSLALSNNYKCMQTHLSGSVDDSLISLAKENDGIVLTNDKELRKKLKEKDLKVIFLRAKKKLSVQ